ncbi:MAG: hypothetical protein EU532_06910 [Promethearchaeota archaeon]|nr:MAG: hypothetical protein EU532_06910 [Candidatus Lokiarchaeota archaeon]
MIAKTFKEIYKDYSAETRQITQITIFNSKEFQKRKLSLISELAVLLTTHNNSQKEYKNISKLIISTLKAPEAFFSDKAFSFTTRNPFENYAFKEYLLTIKKVSILLKQPLFLSVRQILKNCSAERFFINMFLKDFLVKNQSFK